MIRISVESEYAFLLLESIITEPEKLKSASELAEKLKLPLPITSKVLKLLSKAQILKSTRGIFGGYALAKDAKKITVLEVLSALEGNPALVRCAKKDKKGICSCDFVKNCPIRKFWLNMDTNFKNILANKSLADMVGVN